METICYTKFLLGIPSVDVQCLGGREGSIQHCHHCLNEAEQPLTLGSAEPSSKRANRFIFKGCCIGVSRNKLQRAISLLVLGTALAKRTRGGACRLYTRPQPLKGPSLVLHMQCAGNAGHLPLEMVFSTAFCCYILSFQTSQAGFEKQTGSLHFLFVFH